MTGIRIGRACNDALLAVPFQTLIVRILASLFPRIRIEANHPGVWSLEETFSTSGILRFFLGASSSGLILAKA
jgi:hypothetical protein